MKAKCPECGMEINWTGQWPIQVEPQPGGAAACAGCKSLFFYGPDLLPRKATDEEKKEWGSLCPKCLMPIPISCLRAVSADGSEPGPGDGTLCDQCGTLIILGVDGQKWRLPTEKEIGALTPEMRQQMSEVQQVYESRKLSRETIPKIGKRH